MAPAIGVSRAHPRSSLVSGSLNARPRRSAGIRHIPLTGEVFIRTFLEVALRLEPFWGGAIFVFVAAAFGSEGLTFVCRFCSFLAMPESATYNSIFFLFIWAPLKNPSRIPEHLTRNQGINQKNGACEPLAVISIQQAGAPCTVHVPIRAGAPAVDLAACAKGLICWSSSIADKQNKQRPKTGAFVSK